MKNRHRVVWTKGMFLTPQHFQTQDQFFENNLNFRFAASQFANWGVTELKIDTGNFENGQFRSQMQRYYARQAGRLKFREPTRCPSHSVTEHFPPTRFAECFWRYPNTVRAPGM